MVSERDDVLLWFIFTAYIPFDQAPVMFSWWQDISVGDGRNGDKIKLARQENDISLLMNIFY